MGNPALRCSWPPSTQVGACAKVARAASKLLLLMTALLAIAPSLTLAQTQTAPRVVQPFMPRQSIPTDTYFSSFSVYYDGEFKDALKLFRQEGRGAIKSGVAPAWIDSICYHTMTGECYYEMGDLATALDHYNSALRIYVTYYDFMNRVDFPVAINPLTNNNQIVAVPWGQTGRGARIGNFNNAFKMAQGNFNNNAVIQNGGVVQAPVYVTVHVEEIVRTTALAMRRRRDIMGPACAQDALTGELVGLLTRRPCPPNHWSEAWVDAMLGIAYTAAGKDLQAKNVLERCIIAGGQYDHPLTAAVLFELGRLANRAGDFAAADKFFLEASFSATQYPDGTLIEEALRAGQANHLMANRPGVYPPLAAAATWARAKRLRLLEVSLLALAAENAAVLDDGKTALGLLSNARGLMTRTDMGTSRVSARLNYAATLACYQQGKIADGDAALKQAMAFQGSGSLWMFHIGLVDQLFKNGKISSRVALDLYSLVLRDPTAADWRGDPLESLTVQMLPHPLPYEHWFEAALDRKGGTAQAFEIADTVRRYRFLNSQEFGGRLLNLRWLLAGDPEMLSAGALLQRQELLVHYPQLGQLAQQSQALAAEMRQVPLPSETGEAAKKYGIGLTRMAELAQAQELMLRQIAVRREPCEVIFPPRRSVEEMQASLGEKQGVLSFFTAGRDLYAFMMSHDKFGYWKVKSPAGIHKQTVSMLHEIGNYDQNREVTFEELSRQEWKKPAKEVLSMIMDGSRNSLTNLFDELVIVPDGMLWYLPFECLQVGEGYETVPLVTEIQIRYAPLTGLALADPRSRRQGASTGVVVGRLFPRDDQAVAHAAYEQVSQTLKNSYVINSSVGAPSARYAGLIDRLIVYADIAPATGNVYGWTPVQLDQKPQGNTLDDWFLLPWGAPEQMILPGYHTAAENSLKGLKPATAGADMFLNVTGMMATGTRTVLLSRWRTGGQTAFDLVREFAQELPYTTAADAWQRSVFLLKEAELYPDGEPRLKKIAGSSPTSADHPFFWAGYMLVDSGTPAEAIERDPAADIIKKKPKKAAPAPVAEDDKAANDEVVPVDQGEPMPKKKAKGKAKVPPADEVKDEETK